MSVQIAVSELALSLCVFVCLLKSMRIGLYEDQSVLISSLLLGKAISFRIVSHLPLSKLSSLSASTIAGCGVFSAKNLKDLYVNKENTM